MPHDPIRISETKSWFKKALDDLRAAETSLKAHPPLLSISIFHCQQVVEKMLKGFLFWYDQRFRKTHSIEEIDELCIKIDASLKDLIDEAVPLTHYAWRFRYPGEIDEPTDEEIQEALTISKKVYKEILKRLPRETHP